MGIRYINADPNLNFARPTGFLYPTGLTQTEANGPTSVDYLVVAGGGGGSVFIGGGGGAGGFRTASGFSVINGTSYPITVGAGGGPGVSGSDSIFSSITGS